MASISWDFLLRTEKFDSALKKEKQSVGDFVKDVQNGTEKIDKSFDRMGESIKKIEPNLKREKGLIQDIKDTIDKLIASRDKAWKVEDIEKYNQKIAEARKELKEYEEVGLKQEESQNKNIQTLGKYVLGLLTVGVAMKGFKAIMESTEATAVAFHSTINGLKSGMDVLMKTVVSGDWDKWKDLFQGGLWNAIASGKELTKEMDVIQNVRRQYAIQEETLNKEIEESRRVFYEDDSTSISKKIAAGDDMLKDMKAKADMEVDIAVRTYKAIAEISGAKNKLSEADLQFMVRNYNEMEKVGSQYDDLMTVYEKVKKEYDRWDGKGSNVQFSQTWDKEKLAQGIYKLRPTEGMEVMSIAPTAANVKQLEDLIKSLGPLAQEYSDQLKKFDGLNEKEKTAFGDSIVAVMKAENQYLVESKRVFKMKENMTDQEIAKEKEKIKAYNDVINAILILKKEGVDKELQELKGKYEDDLELYKDDEEMKVALKEKYELEKFDIEKKYLKKLLDEAKKAADQIAKDTGISPYSITQRYLSGKSSSGVTQTNALPSGLLPSQSNAPDQDKENTLQKQYELRQKILYAATELTVQLADQLGLEDEAVARLSDLAGIVEGIASDNYAQAASSLISFVTESIKASDTWAQVIDIDKLERLAELSEKALKQGGAKSALESELDVLKTALKDAEWQVEYHEKKLRHANSINREEREKNLEQAKQELEGIQDQYDQAEESYNNLMAGGITKSIIADAVANGFIEGGKTGVDSVADYMTDVLKNAAIEVFKGNILDSPAMQAYIDATTQALNDNIITEDEKAQLDRRAKEMAETWGPAWESLMGTFDTMGQAGGLTGAIKGVTEDTASELAGILRGVRDDVRQGKAFDRMSVTHLAKIEANTYNTVVELQKANVKLDTVISNTKPVLAGDL